MMPNISADIIQEQFEHEHNTLNMLIDMLGKEQTILESGTPDDLYQLLQEKDKVVASLEALIAKRNNLFRDNDNADSSKEFLQKMSAQNPEYEPCLSLLEKNNALMIKCQDKNIINGCVINHNYHQTQRLMQAIMGSAISQTYTKAGNNKTEAAGKTIGRA